MTFIMGGLFCFAVMVLWRDGKRKIELVDVALSLFSLSMIILGIVAII